MEFVLAATLAVAFVLMTAVFWHPIETSTRLERKGRKITWDRPENISIALNYRLKKKGDEWKIYDVIVDEASLVDNYRYQFNSIITKHGYADLIRRMNEKLNGIIADRKAAEVKTEVKAAK